MTLNSFSDQYPSLTKRLFEARKNGRIAHGYLIVGDQPQKLESFVNAWLQVVLCSSPKENGDACGVCKYCEQISKGHYPFYKEVKPHSKMRQIRVDDILALEHFLHLTSDGKYRVAVIWDADRMNIQTHNAFLKTLEEPLERTIILMVSQNPSQLLATIRSRIQTIALLDNKTLYDYPQFESVKDALKSFLPGAGALVATQTTRAIQDTLDEIKHLADVDAKAALKELKQDLENMEPSIRKAKEAEAEAMMQSRYRAQRELVISTIHTWFSCLYMHSLKVKKEVMPHPEFQELLPYEVDPFRIRQALETTERFVQEINFNVDEKLMLESYCQQICKKA